MKYILKYKTRSKYFGFAREYMKEFDSTLNIAKFIKNNYVIEWKVYEQKNIKLPIGENERQRNIS